MWGRVRKIGFASSRGRTGRARKLGRIDDGKVSSMAASISAIAVDPEARWR